LDQHCIPMDIPYFSRVAVHSCFGKSAEGRKNALCNYLVVSFPFYSPGCVDMCLERVYALLAVYLLVCSFWLTVISFAVSTFMRVLFDIHIQLNI
jgi:hypothetical protein